ncbi:MAG TPA: hypothetical protein VF502_10155 [Stellaceae bacterium]
MAKDRRETSDAKASTEPRPASNAPKGEPIVILDAHDGTPLIIVPTSTAGEPAKAPQPGAATAPGPEKK